MSGSSRSFWRAIGWGAVGLGLLALMGLMGYLIATADGKSPREAGLEAFILTAASWLASLLVTRTYAEGGSAQRLRDHGVQIASSIMTLKRQIETLMAWVSAKRRTCRRGGVTDAALDHIGESLNGFDSQTEVALNGITGIIGDALDQYNAVMDKVARIRGTEQVQATQIEREMADARSDPAKVAQLQEAFQELRASSARQVAQVVRTSPLPVPDQPNYQRVRAACPYCSAENTFDILNRVGETKVVFCQNCRMTFNAHLLPGDQVATRRLGAVQELLPVTGGEFQPDQADRFLRNTQMRVSPDLLDKVVQVVLSADQAMRQAGVARSPYALQPNALAGLRTQNAPGVPTAQLRVFMKAAFQGGAFRDRPDQPFAFGSEFQKTLTEAVLLEGYARGCLNRLRTLFRIREEHVGDVAALLFGAGGPRLEPLMRRVLGSVGGRPESARVAAESS